MTRRYAVWISLVSITAAVVLNTSLETRQQQDRLAEINREIKAEQERIRVLTAEWHTLKTPERLEELAARHLPGYTAIKPLQMAALADVPERLPEPVEAPRAVAQVVAPKPATVVAAPKPTVVAAAPVAAAPVRQVAAVATPRARPAAPIAAPKPAAAPAREEKQDDLARLIARNDVATPAPTPAARPATRGNDDGIRMLIERQPQQGITRTSFGGNE